MEKLEKFLGKYFWAVLLLLSIPSFWALFVPGFFGASDDLHVGWLYEMNKAVSLHQIPPRFVPDLSFGFGYPLFNFVFPLPFYLGELFHLIGLSLVDSVKAVFLISLPLSGIFMYMLLNEFIAPMLSLAGALVFIYTPYRSTEIYVRGAFGEALTFIFLPLITLSVVKLVKSERVRVWIGAGGLSLAGLILSHNITSYMFIPFPFLLAVMLLIFASPKKKTALITLGLALLLGLMASSYFWFPALRDSGLMKYDTVYNYLDHFPTLKQLVTPYFGYGISVPGPYDSMSFFIGSINLVLFALSIIFLTLRWGSYTLAKRIFLLWAVVSFLLAVFMMDFRSDFIWRNIPLLPYFQFPWRFLVVTTFTSSLMVVIFERFKYQRLVGLSIIIFAVALNWGFFRPHDFLGREDSYYFNKYIPIPVASSEYQKLAEEYLRLPKATQVRPERNYPLLETQGGRVDQLKRLNDLDSEILVSASSSTLINYNKYDFPGWSARVDGKSVPIFPGRPFGQISLDIPEGQHFVKISFNETPTNRLLDILSGAAFLSAIILIYSSRKVKIKE